MQHALRNKLIFVSSIIGFIAFFWQSYFTLSKKMAEGFSFVYSLNHYLSYFTIIINLALSIFFFMYSVHPTSKVTNWFKRGIVNGAVCLYILIVGIIYYGLLYKDVHTQGPEFVIGHIMHAYMPLVYLYCWYFIFRDSSLRYLDGVKWLSVPFVYFIYLMIRGQLIGKYPYFFVDIEKFGILTVGMFAVAILTFFLLVGSILVFIDRKAQIKKNQ